MGCCNPHRNNNLSYEEKRKSEQKDRDYEEKISNLQGENQSLKEELEKYKTIKELNRSNSFESDGSNSSIASDNSNLSGSSGNSQGGKALKKFIIRFNGTNYTISAKSGHKFLKILDIFRKQENLLPKGKFKYNGEEISLFTTPKKLGLNEDAIIDLE